MVSMKFKRITWFFLVVLAAVLPLAAGRMAVPARAQGGSAWELIDAVNALRIANGLKPYKVNDALMAAAQSHSEYQANTGTMTHSGKGGSNSTQRAAAFGYGGGASIRVTENIAGGTSMTPQIAVNMWQGDSVHLNAMLSASYTDAGAGVAFDGKVYYFTLDVGYIEGQAGSPPTSSNQTPSNKSSTGNTSAQPAVVIMAVKVAEPKEDGSIVHEVEPGHTLIKIAEAYKIPLADLLALNNLTFDSIIYPGEKLIIRLSEPTPTATEVILPTATLAPRPTATKIPRQTPEAVAAAPIQATSTAVIEAAAQEGTAMMLSDPVLLIIGALIVVGAGLLVVGVVVRRPG